MVDIPLQQRTFVRWCAELALFTIFLSVLWISIWYERVEPDYKADHMHDSYIDKGKSFPIEPDWSATPTQVDQLIEQEAIDILEATHGAPERSDRDLSLYNKICTVYADICGKVTRDGDFSPEERLQYQLLTIYLIREIDKRITIPDNKLRTTLSRLTIYQSEEGRRGSAGHTHLRMNVQKIDTMQEYREVLSHELGHILDLGVITGTSPQKNRAYTEFDTVRRAIDDPSIDFYEISRISENVRKSEATYKDFVSGYAMKGIYEEFAETKNLWFNHHELFRQLAAENTIMAEKYDFFQELYGNQYFAENVTHVDVISDNKRPWDTTKIGQ